MANLIGSTEAFDDTDDWTPTDITVTPNTHTAPAFASVGAGPADTVADISAVAQGILVATYVDIPADTSSYVGSVYIRKDGTADRWPEVFLQIQSVTAGFVSLNTVTGAIADGSSPPAASGIVDVDATWWRLWMRIANNGAGVIIRLGLYPDHLDALGGSTSSLPTGSVVVWGANITPGSTLLAYEPQPAYGGAIVLSGVSATAVVGSVVAPTVLLTRLPIDVGGVVGDPAATDTIRSGFGKVNTMMSELYPAIAPLGSPTTIDHGVTLNDPGADAIRLAFQDINTMATELYAVTGGTRPVINVGAFANDPSAETIYSAFTKVNTITTDLYAAVDGVGPRVIPQPPGAVLLNAGATSAQIQTAITANPAGTTFWFPAGTYAFTSVLTPKSNQSFVGEYGAIFDGTGWSSADLDDGFFRGIDNGVTGVTVKNLVMQNGPHYGVNAYVSASGWTVIYCEIAHNLTGVSVGTAGVINRNYIHHNAGDAGAGDPALRGGGISLSGATGAQIIYNEIAYNGMEQKSAAAGPGLNQSVYYAHNWYHHNVGNGIWNDGDGAGTIIEYNTVEDNGGAGIDVEYSNGVIVRNNLVRRQTANEGIYLTVSKNLTVTGNTVTNNAFGIGMFLDFVSLFPNSVDAAWHQDLANNNVSGNTVTAVTALPSQKLAYYSLQNKGLGGISPTPYETNTKNNVWASNTYFAPTTSGSWFLWDGVNHTFTTWQAVPQDAGSSIAIG